MNATYRYELVVDGNDADGYTAVVGGSGSPHRGHGESPLQAIAALCESIREWPIGGADRWLKTTEGTKLARTFCPTFEPGQGGTKS